MTKLGEFHVMGMRCWKCHVEIGGLCIPKDKYTSEEFGKFLIDNRILPMCENCIKSNPAFVSAENLVKGK